METSEHAKRDMVVIYDGRTFALRAYRDDAITDGPQWRSLIIENRTPLRYEQRSASDPASCLAEAVRHLTADIEARAELEGAKPTPADAALPGNAARGDVRA